jgi:two-component system sensor histidine kinase/response regulator
MMMTLSARHAQTLLDRPFDILIVDDTPANLRLLAQLLMEHGYKVRAVLNGQRAIEAAQAQVPDLILLDVMMPDLDGYAVCQRLKSLPATREVPVIFISALDEANDKVKAFTAGGVDYVTKPFEPREILARVQTHLTLHRLTRRLELVNASQAQQLAELEARNEELDAFAHTVAHDIKSPMAVISGYSDLLLEAFDDLPPDKRTEALYSISRGTQKIVNIVDELLLLAGVRRTEVQLAPINMERVIREVKQRVEYMLVESQAEVIIPETWPVASGYAPWIEEVWVNYLTNACKYGGQPPQIELGADPQGFPSAPPPKSGGQGENPEGLRLVRFWVRDNGKGLSPEDQARLFTPFTRLDQARARGHGLGLSIVRRIVEKQGGQVGVMSSGVPGEGCTFYFTLPASS